MPFVLPPPEFIHKGMTIFGLLMSLAVAVAYFLFYRNKQLDERFAVGLFLAAAFLLAGSLLGVVDSFLAADIKAHRDAEIAQARASAKSEASQKTDAQKVPASEQTTAPGPAPALSAASTPATLTLTLKNGMTVTGTPEEVAALVLALKP